MSTPLHHSHIWFLGPFPFVLRAMPSPSTSSSSSSPSSSLSSLRSYHEEEESLNLRIYLFHLILVWFWFWSWSGSGLSFWSPSPFLVSPAAPDFWVERELIIPFETEGESANGIWLRLLYSAIYETDKRTTTTVCSDYPILMLINIFLLTHTPRLTLTYFSFSSVTVWMESLVKS